MLFVPALVLTAGCASQSQTVSPADLVLTNGRVVTVEESQPEAQAIAITGDRIVAVGSSGDIRPYVGPAHAGRST